MAYKRAKLLLLLISLVLSAAFIIGAGPAPAHKAEVRRLSRYGGMPGAIRPSPSVAIPGESVTITVTLDETTSTDQEVAVSTSTPGMFVSYPSSVVVPAGLDNVSFTVYVRTDAGMSSIGLTATCNGSSAYGAMAVTIPPDPILTK
jgi:hypothetical protein